MIEKNDEEEYIDLLDEFSEVESDVSMEDHNANKLEILQQRGLVVNPTEPKRKVSQQPENSSQEEINKYEHDEVSNHLFFTINVL